MKEKTDMTRVRFQSNRKSRVWCALYTQSAEYRSVWPHCYNVEFGSKHGPLLEEEVILKLARKLLDEDPDLTALCGIVPGDRRQNHL